MKVDAEPSCVTRKALQPAGTPVGPMTNDRPNRSVRMLGSPALLLPASSRFVLNVAGEGSAVARRAPPRRDVAAATGLAPRDAPSETMKRTTMTDERARALRALRGMRVPPAKRIGFAVDVRRPRSTTGARTSARSLRRPTAGARSMSGE